MNVPLLDLKAQYLSISKEIDDAIAQVFANHCFILGPQVKELEKNIAEYSNCRFSTGVSSGTDALLISLMSENIGIGDEVITSTFTFFATGGSISRTGATPVFVDIDPITYNIDPECIEKAITHRTKAIIPVHLYGQMADMDPIMEIAKKYSLIVIEDAAQAIGAEYKGHRAGSIGHYGCFSFFPSKNLGAAGDGGIVTTNDPERANNLNLLRSHGANPKYYHARIGGNFRLDTLQAAIVLVKLKHLDFWTTKRRNNATKYKILFENTSLLETGNIVLPKEMTNRHIYNQFIIRAKERNNLKDFLKNRGVSSEVYYPVPLHVQECFSPLGYQKGDLPISETASEETLAIPIYPELTDDMISYVVSTINEFFT